MCLFGICSKAPEFGEPMEPGEPGGVGWEHRHPGSAGLCQHGLHGGGGLGNYAKATNYSDKVIHQIISHNFNSSPEFPYFQSQLDILLPELLKRWNPSHGAKGRATMQSISFYCSLSTEISLGSITHMSTADTYIC